MLVNVVSLSSKVLYDLTYTNFRFTETWEQAEAEVVPSSSLVEVKVEVEVRGPVEVGVKVFEL